MGQGQTEPDSLPVMRLLPVGTDTIEGLHLEMSDRHLNCDPSEGCEDANQRKVPASIFHVLQRKGVRKRIVGK